MICQTVRVAQHLADHFTAQREFPIPEINNETVELTRAPFEHELAGQRTRPFKDAELEVQLRAAKHLFR